MTQRTRILIVLALFILIGAALGAYTLLNMQKIASAPPSTPQPGMIHVYVDGTVTANLAPADLEKLPPSSFNDLEEGKPQEGWWLRDVVRLYVPESKLTPASRITVAGLRQATAKTFTLTWAQAVEPANNVGFDLAGDGQSMKLASTMEGFAVRDAWVQGVNRIDIQTRP
jgi:hypothetical protein